MGKELSNQKLFMIECIAAISILAILALIFWLAIFFGTTFEKTQYKELTPREKIEHRKLLTKHGLIGKIAVIEIRASDNTLWYPFHGKLAQLK